MDKDKISYLKDNIRYDPHTGLFWWIKRGSRRTLSKPAGCTNSYGYRVIKLGDTSYKAHRLAFILMGKDLPKCVDHINGVKDDNRWCNLRAACHTGNNFNKTKQKNNSSGFKRVSFNKQANKWGSYIQLNGTQRFLGYFDTPEEAHKVYCEAADRIAKGFANYG